MKACDTPVLSFPSLLRKVSGGGAEVGSLQKTSLHNLLLQFWLLDR